MRHLFIITLLFPVLTLMPSSAQSQAFRHPGLLHSQQSIERMRTHIRQKKEPVYAAFQALTAEKKAQSDYKMAGPFEVIARDGAHRSTKGGSESDFSAAYYNALTYQLTGDEASAKKAEEIISAYTETLQGIDGHDAPLCCLQGYFLVNACELLRDRIDNGKVKEMLQRAFIPVMNRFEADSPYANGNWGAIVNKMRMAVAIYTDDRALYDASKEYYLHANDNGSLPKYIDEKGQCQETGRDQAHAQLGVGNLAETCEMAWNQGDDLYAALDNRLLKGYEYMAKYNLGYDVPFTQWTDCTGLYNDWPEPGQMQRGNLFPIYEVAYNHYVGRNGMKMPYTAMVLGKAGGKRPEKSTGGCDAMGIGSLLFYQDTKTDNKSKAPGVQPYEKLHQVYTYPAPKGAPLKNDYDVFVQPRGGKEWTKVDTYMAKVNAPIGNNKHKVCEISYAMFDFTGDVFVRVVCKNKKYQSARVRPDYKGVIANQLNDSTMQFLLFQPENVSVEFDGSITNNLLIFTSKPLQPVEEARKEAEAAGRKFVYYAPGFYTNDTIAVASNTTVYLDGGSYFTGYFSIKNAENTSIIGRGIARPSRGYLGAYVHNSHNVLIDGLTLNTCPIGGSDGVTLHDVRSISHPGWGDGLNVFASSNVLYDRVFCRNSDDCTTAYATRKGFEGSVHNVVMRNSTLWADVAHPIMIGLHGAAAGPHPERPDSIVGLRYENIDILCQSEPQVDYQGCMAINCGDNNLVKDVVFDNIRIENLDQGSLLHLRVCYNKKYCAAPGRGIEDITFRNIRYKGDNPYMSVIQGYDENHKVKNIRFEGLRINGQLIYDTMPGKPSWYKTADIARFYVNDHVENITFTINENENEDYF